MDLEVQRMIDSYLRRLENELSDVPAGARRELVEDVRAHIQEALAEAGEPSQAAVLNVLERLGEPADLAREERERLGLTPEPAAEQGPDLLSAAAVVLTALFWPVGVLLAWLSPRWSGRDKAVATLMPVLGLTLVFSLTFAASHQYGITTSSQHVVQVSDPDAEVPAQPEVPQPGIEAYLRPALAQILFLTGLFGAPFGAAAYLALRLRRGTRRRAPLIPAVAAGLVLVSIVLLLVLPPERVGPGLRSGPVQEMEIVVPQRQP